MKTIRTFFCFLFGFMLPHIYLDAADGNLKKMSAAIIVALLSLWALVLVPRESN